MGINDFSGFPQETFKFLKGLAKNNNQDWFEAHRDDYMQYFVAPAQAFVLAMEPRLHKLSKGIVAHPDYKGKGSIKKIFTDRRFNPDRPPYKTWLDIMFWEGPVKSKKDNSAFYLRLTADKLFFFTGIKGFNNQVLKGFRKHVSDASNAAKLGSALAKLKKVKGLKLNEPSFKNVPRGFAESPKHPELIRHGALYAFVEEKVPAVAHSAKLLDYAEKRFKETAPLHKWLVGMLGG